MNFKPVEVLLVEGDGTCVEAVRRVFASGRPEVQLSVAGSLSEARAILDGRAVELVIAGAGLPDGAGRDLIPSGAQLPALPVVVLTDPSSAQAEAEALQAGAWDCVARSEAGLAELPGVAARALRQREYLVERRRIGQWASGIVHDLRNHLGVVRNAVFFLKRKVSAQEAKCQEYLTLIEQEMAAADQIIAALAALGRDQSLA